MPMRVEIMFPVTIAMWELDDILREKVRSRVYAYLESEAAKKVINPSPIEALETSFFAPQHSVLDDAGLHELKQVLLANGEEFMRWYGIGPIPLEFERSWINLFRPGMQESEHEHNGSVLSGTYYVDAPDNCGNFVVQDPIGARRAHRAWTGTNGATPPTVTEMAYPPKAGRMYMFESWMPHQVTGNKSNQTRISIAFNFRRKR